MIACGAREFGDGAGGSLASVRKDAHNAGNGGCMYYKQINSRLTAWLPLWVMAMAAPLMGQVNFNAPRTFPVNNNPADGIAISDFNGDGIPDLAVAMPGEWYEILLGDGHGGFQGLGLVSPPHCVSGLALGDFNGDGR